MAARRRVDGPPPPPSPCFLVSSPEDMRLTLHSAVDAVEVGTFGGEGTAPGEFFFYFGGICPTSRGTVLVAESENNRVQEVELVAGAASPRCVRVIGDGCLAEPEFVACNDDAIVVTEYSHRITVFSWLDGGVRAQFGRQGSGPGELFYPCGVRIRADGATLVVADSWNQRLCVYTLTGQLVTTIAVCADGGSTLYPTDVLEMNGVYLVVCARARSLLAVSADDSGGCVTLPLALPHVYGFKTPTAIAWLPHDDVLVVADDGCFHLFHTRELRAAWIGLVVRTAGAFDGV